MLQWWADLVDAQIEEGRKVVIGRFGSQVAERVGHDLDPLNIWVARNHSRSSSNFRASVRSRALPARMASNRARLSYRGGLCKAAAGADG